MAKLHAKNYKEFKNAECAHKWGLYNYSTWLEQLNKTITLEGEKHGDNISDALYRYSGSGNILYNRYICNNEVFCDYDEDIIELCKNDIQLINDELIKFSTSENIIAYRFTRKEWLKSLFPFSKLKGGEEFVYKGFTSTTLCPEEMIRFAKNRSYNCILKLFLPKGTKGAYIYFPRSILRESEFLLPLNSTFKLLKKGFWFRGFIRLYECELIRQE